MACCSYDCDCKCCNPSESFWADPSNWILGIALICIAGLALIPVLIVTVYVLSYIIAFILVIGGTLLVLGLFIEYLSNRLGLD